LNRSFGSGRTESEIVCLEEQAMQYVRAQGGFVDDFFIDRDETALKNFIETITNDSIRDVPAFGCKPPVQSGKQIENY
jgi:hypothetical protein